MDAKVIESRLLRNPKYSSNWIETAAKILSASTMFTEKDLTNYNAEQLDILNGAIEFNAKADEAARVSIPAIARPELNATQMRLMLAGLQNKVPVEFLNKAITTETPYATSNYLIQGYIDGFNMSKYFKGYDNDQIYEIYAGFRNKVDVTKYDKPGISSDVMGLIRHALEIKKNITVDIKSEILTISMT